MYILNAEIHRSHSNHCAQWAVKQLTFQFPWDHTTLWSSLRHFPFKYKIKKKVRAYKNPQNSLLITKPLMNSIHRAELLLFVRHVNGFAAPLGSGYTFDSVATCWRHSSGWSTWVRPPAARPGSPAEAASSEQRQRWHSETSPASIRSVGGSSERWRKHPWFKHAEHTGMCFSEGDSKHPPMKYFLPRPKKKHWTTSGHQSGCSNWAGISNRYI